MAIPSKASGPRGNGSRPIAAPTSVTASMKAIETAATTAKPATRAAVSRSREAPVESQSSMRPRSSSPRPAPVPASSAQKA